MTIQTEQHLTIAYIDQGKCCVCGQPATTEIKEVQREFCQAHLVELRQKIDDWVSREISYHDKYKGYTKQREER